MKANSGSRIRLISLAIFIFAMLLIVRLYFVQIIKNENYLDKADRQYTSTAQKIFSRGSIFFENKDGSLVSAATLKSGVTVAINPVILKNIDAAYEKLNEILPTNYDDFYEKAVKKNDPYEVIVEKAEGDVGQKINDLKIPGLSAYKERWRFYPGGSTASHIVGILGYKGDEYAGRYGLEREFETELLRKDGAYVNFFAEIFSDIKRVTVEESPGEADVVTTIEPTTQTFLEKVLASTTEKWNSESTGGIIMDPKTGEIYAMEVNPTFDPNNISGEKKVSIFGNPLIENVYEMGSIIKPLTVAAGIDAGVITSKSTYYDKGYVVINNKKISNFDGKERGTVTIQDLLSQSLNVGAAHIESLLGNKRFADYIWKLGLGEKTGIDLPNEGRNLVGNLRGNVDIDFATASFGQGIALTPISTVRALAVLANGGVLVSPHVVKTLDYKIGPSKDTKIEKGTQVFKKETIDDVTRMMVYSVDHVLRDGSLKIPNYSVAVKTGTAQIAKEGGGGYLEGVYLHSFIGFFPAYNPRFVIFLYTLKPRGAKYGSETLTDPFFDITKFLINYYEIPPDR